MKGRTYLRRIQGSYVWLRYACHDPSGPSLKVSLPSKWLSNGGASTLSCLDTGLSQDLKDTAALALFTFSGSLPPDPRRSLAST